MELVGLAGFFGGLGPVDFGSRVKVPPLIEFTLVNVFFFWIDLGA
jgi:hypothetical protein